MPRPLAVLGIDLGTSRLKALLCAADGPETGRTLGQGTAGYQVSAPRDGWAETDPAQWWQAARAAVREAVGPARAEVAGLAVVGQMHGLVLQSERSGYLRPAITWLDRRAEAEVSDYQRLPEDLRAKLGNAPSPGMAGPILLWLARHEPDACRRARWMLQPKDWLRMRLTGQAATDPSDASGTLLYDLGRDAWAADVAEALGLRTALLPPVLPSAQAAGTLLPAAADALGLPPGLPVATGASDTAASLLASRVGQHWGLLTLGTGGQWIIPAAGGGLDERTGTSLFRAVGDGTFRLGGVQNVGAALDWVRRTLGGSWDDLYDTAARPWDPGTPVFLPYLAGERGQDGAAGGAWTGLTLAHQRGDLLRAALEGVAYLLRAKLDDLRELGCAPAQVMLAGGGGEHSAWRRLLADVLATPLYPARTEGLTARGAVLLAAQAAGLRSGTEHQDRSASDRDAPVAASGAVRAQAGYGRFRAARACLRTG